MLPIGNLIARQMSPSNAAPSEYNRGVGDGVNAYLPELNRLHRIEEAARGILDCVDRPGGTVRAITGEAIMQLREALKP